jgi:hypothetical protein
MANMFGDHMVLQQAPARANVWGYVMKCDSTVTVTFDGQTYPATTFTGKPCSWGEVGVSLNGCDSPSSILP